MEKSIQLKLTNITLLSFLLLVCFSSKAQLSEEYKLYKGKYPDSHLVRLKHEIIISVDLDDDDFNITQEFFEEDLYLNEAATYGSKRSVSFSTFFEIEEIEAASYSFENGKYRETKVTEFTTKDELEGSFHDDAQSLNFIYPKLGKGSKSILKYTEKVKNPRFLTPFYFGDFFPIKSNKVTLVADKDIEFSFLEFNTDKLNINFKKTEKRGNYIYTWEVTNIDEFDYEEGVPSYKKIFPHIVPVIKSYKKDDETITLLSNVSDLYNWYYSLVKDINKNPTSDDLVAITNELIQDKKTNKEKVEAIYYWVQQNIKYIAFEYALGGFIPREANDVFAKKYGDCKDNSSILFEMLKIAGLKGNLTWIGTRSIPYSYNQLPTPMVDNHMILTYTENDNTYYLDATGRHLPLDMPSSFIQGKEALISVDETNFTIKEVPVMSPQTSSEINNTTLFLEEDEVKGTSNVKFSGYKKIFMFESLENKKTQDELLEYYNFRLRKGNNKFLINNFKEENKYSYDKDFIIDFDFNVKSYAKKLGDEIYLNLNLNKELSDYKTEENRKHEIEYVFKQYYNYKTTFKIPEGYTVEYLPENFTLESDLANSSISYMLNGDEILYEHTIELKFLNLNLAQQKQFNTFIKTIEKHYKEVVILKKI